MNFVYLTIAVTAEVIGTAALNASQQFTRLVPVIIAVAGYAAAFYFLSLTLRTIPVGIAYAIWSGIGIVLITLIGVFWFRQPLDWPAVAGIALILGGVLVINVYSKTMAH